MHSKVCFIFHLHIPKKIHIWGISKIVKANFSVIPAKSHFILDCTEQLLEVIVIRAESSHHYGGGGQLCRWQLRKTRTDGETYCRVTVGRVGQRGMNVIRPGQGIISIQKTCPVTLAIIFISNVFFE